MGTPAAGPEDTATAPGGAAASPAKHEGRREWGRAYGVKPIEARSGAKVSQDVPAVERMPGAVQRALRERTWTRLIQASFLRGEFVLSSGRNSTHYIDKYRFETRPDLLRDIARLLAQVLPPETTALAGAAVGGVPLATAVALETGLPFVIVRPEAKGHGTARTIEGRHSASSARPLKFRTRMCVRSAPTGSIPRA